MSLGIITQKPSDERGWKQAQLGIAEGGLGLRNPGRHAGAAYVASVRSTRLKCKEADPRYRKDEQEGELERRELEGDIPQEAYGGGPEGKGAQKYRSALVDTRIRMELEAVRERTGPTNNFWP